jgi:hypothetical protein
MFADKLKAIVVAILGAVLFWIKTKFSIELGPEVKSTIVGLITGLVVWIIPNAKPVETAKT